MPLVESSISVLAQTKGKMWTHVDRQTRRTDLRNEFSLQLDEGETMAARKRKATKKATKKRATKKATKKRKKASKKKKK